MSYSGVRGLPGQKWLGEASLAQFRCRHCKEHSWQFLEGRGMGVNETQAGQCEPGFSREGIGWLGRKGGKERGFALYTLCIVEIILTRCFH